MLQRHTPLFKISSAPFSKVTTLRGWAKATKRTPNSIDARSLIMAIFMSRSPVVLLAYLSTLLLRLAHEPRA
ncbi:hypothetical protein T11_1771 [Trichinella zimbabwensis]|uniref:Uncharacterized protein n=1 Tax=Trichinella zimbabwensis TaxID=268475 RepID=A0A0V1HAP7_9BILA|nr:hypothetical protein T11_1771 [Trichinella zimbabwensis]